MFKPILKVLLVIIPFSVFGQLKPEVKHIITDTRDSLFLKSYDLAFDTAGNYRITAEMDDGYYFFTNKGKTGPLHFHTASDVSDYTDKKAEKNHYYTLNGSINVFGPYTGEDIADFRYPVSHNGRHVAFPFVEGDSISIYLDGKLANRIDLKCSTVMTYNGKEMDEAYTKKWHFSSAGWLNFSNNGNSLYVLENGKEEAVYKNGVLIDKGSDLYNTPYINDGGYYMYLMEKIRVPFDSMQSQYQVFLQTSDTVFGPLDNGLNDCWLRNDSGYYYGGSNLNLLIDNQYYDYVEDVANIRIMDKKHYMFTCAQLDLQKINVSGNFYEYHYHSVYSPTADVNGNFAFYGLKNYYLNKFVNGVEVKQPLSKFGVRAMPLYISPTGQSLHYFRTDDSTFIYRDEKRLFGLKNSTPFVVKQLCDFFMRSFERDAPLCAHDAFYMQIDSTGYMVYDGIFSPPMPVAKDAGYGRNAEVGGVVQCVLDENGFYLIQKTGEHEFTVNINNRLFSKVRMDSSIPESYFFNGKLLMFYGFDGLTVNQYKFRL